MKCGVLHAFIAVVVGTSAVGKEAAGVLREIDASGRDEVLDRWIEAEVGARRKSEPASGAQRCAGCGQALRAGASFCDGCGARAETARCPACGASLRPGARFCGACGGKR